MNKIWKRNINWLPKEPDPVWKNIGAINQFKFSPVHHPLDAWYYSVVDEPSTELIFGFTLVTNSVGNRSLI
jgi:hypothetical protein